MKEIIGFGSSLYQVAVPQLLHSQVKFNQRNIRRVIIE